MEVCMSKLLVIENEKIIVKVCTLGATLTSYHIKELETDIVLGFDDLSMYKEKACASMGKTVGRCANRIGNGKYTLNGVEYSLFVNNGPNSLHGGKVRFGDVEWEVEEVNDKRTQLSYISRDMESGFPGNLKTKVIYEIEGYNLKITFEGISDKDTIFNITNHSYFNLDKNKSDILGHELYIPAKRVNLNDESGMAMEKTIDVNGTAFDFLKYRKIGDKVDVNGVPLNDYCKKIIDNSIDTNEDKKVDNLDINYTYETMDEKELCSLKNDVIELRVISDLPGVQIYTGKSLNVDGRNGHFGTYAGVAIEPQFCPNAINYNDFLKPVIKKDERVSHYINYNIMLVPKG